MHKLTGCTPSKISMEAKCVLPKAPLNALIKMNTSDNEINSIGCQRYITHPLLLALSTDKWYIYHICSPDE